MHQLWTILHQSGSNHLGLRSNQDACVGAGTCIGAGGVNPELMEAFASEEQCNSHGVCGPLPFGLYGSWSSSDDSASWSGVDNWNPNMTTEVACIPAPCFDRLPAAKCALTISAGIFSCAADYCTGPGCAMAGSCDLTCGVCTPSTLDWTGHSWCLSLLFSHCLSLTFHCLSSNFYCILFGLAAAFP